jgi:hypothetical protein
MKLQADCLAGVWGHSTQQRDIVDSSDIAAGMEAVAAVGNDRLQKMARGHVSPESFTHGSPRSVPIGSVAALSPEISSPATLSASRDGKSG